MRGTDYLKFLERWEFINNLPLEEAIKRIDLSILETFLKEWETLQISSIKTDEICSKSSEIPMVPVSALNSFDPDLITNIALYSDKQIIPDPIDIAVDKTADPLENVPRFLYYTKSGISKLLQIRPLLRENLVDLISYRSISSQFSSELNDQLYDDWNHNKSLQYLESKMKCKLYSNENVLAFRVGDSDITPFERYAVIGGKSIRETEDTIDVPLIVPPDLKSVDTKIVDRWTDHMFHTTANRVANAINQRLVLAEIFSGSVATGEIISYEYIKRKGFKSQLPKDVSKTVHMMPVLGDIDLEKFLEYRSNELPSFKSFREEWNEGRGLFRENISSEEWVNNLNSELDKCRAEIHKCKEKIINNTLEGMAWGGIGVAVGVFSGGSLSAATLASLPFVARDIKNAIAAYHEMQSSFKASSPFFLLNVLDKKTNTIRTDAPSDLPRKIPFDLNKLLSPISIMNGMPITRELFPQGKNEFFTMKI